MIGQLLVLLLPFVVLFAWVAMAHRVGVVAAARGQDQGYWFRLAILISPMIAAILLVSSTRPPRDRWR